MLIIIIACFLAGRTNLQRAAAASAANEQNFFPGEPDGPKIVTDTIPGPKTKARLADLTKIQVCNNFFFVNGNLNKRGQFNAQIFLF